MTGLIVRAPATTRERTHRIAALDGIRGFAVFAVLAFHTDSQWLASGYLGVDVFFVLSGFLIADILMRQLRTRPIGSALGQFWLRRARRLAPALLVLMAAVSLQRIFWPSSGNYGQGPILAALTYTTNWFEMVRGGTYFGEFGQPSLLLHTWSVAIEEQYYLLFPLILLLVLSFVRSRRAVAWVMLALALMSAAWMAFLSQSGASELRLYMGTDTRAQSLLVGAAVGCLLGRRQGTVAFRSIDVIGGLGIIVLVVTMVVVRDPTTLYRGGFLLQAAAAAAVIIAVLQPGSLAQIFSWRPLVWVGSISYSVYLWHFPIFAWIQGHDEFPAAIGAQLWSWVLTLLVALLSQRLVERPFLTGRFVRWPVWRQWLLYLVTAGVIAVSCLVPAGAFARAQYMQWPTAGRMPAKVLIMGDSTAYGLDLFFPHERLPETQIGGTYELGCGFSELPYRFRGGVTDVAKCQQWEQRTREYVLRQQPATTVIQSHAWVAFDRTRDGIDYPPGTAVFDDDYTKTLRRAIAVGGADGRIPVYLVKIGCPAPLFDREIIGDPARIRIVNALTDQVAASMPQTHVVESSDVTCRNGRPVEDGDNPHYRDDGLHWTRIGAETMWNEIAWAMSGSLP